MVSTSNAVTPLDGFTFGADPELFIVDDKGRHVSAEGLIPGTKLEPHPVEGGAVQVDGMAAEFNIDPVDNFDAFNHNINKVMGALKAMLPKGYGFSVIPSVEFDEEVWANSPDEAKALGCSPDFNAWTGGVNPPPMNNDRPRLRTASGHLHIGWTKDADTSDLGHLTACQDLVKQLDWFLGAWSLTKDPDPIRRSLYGKAGACRYKDYGVEYRVLSNFWITSKPKRLEVWNRMNTAINLMASIYLPGRSTYQRFSGTLIESINTSHLSSDLTRNFTFPIKTIKLD